jgi:hypothetical protein
MGRSGLNGLDILAQFQPVFIREREVCQHKIRLCLYDAFERLRSVLRLATCP